MVSLPLPVQTEHRLVTVPTALPSTGNQTLRAELELHQMFPGPTSRLSPPRAQAPRWGQPRAWWRLPACSWSAGWLICSCASPTPSTRPPWWWRWPATSQPPTPASSPTYSCTAWRSFLAHVKGKCAHQVSARWAHCCVCLYLMIKVLSKRLWFVSDINSKF